MAVFLLLLNNMMVNKVKNKNKIDTDAGKVKEILERGVEEIIVKEHLEKRLISGKQLVIYYGIDPTSPVLHLGHSITLRKLAKFQELGHKVILLIGDFTARIGDPTDKSATRQPLSEQQVKENMKDYKKQASRILDFDKVELKYNGDWWDKMLAKKMVEISSNLSVQKMLSRDMFEQRLKEGKTIGMHELLYPLMQGWDSVAMNVDLEIAGSDQLFNMLVGRELQKTYNKKDKDVLTMKLLPGTDGRKMSKTFGNTIGLTEKPNEMFGKIMSMRDELISEYFKLCTDFSMQEIKRIEKEILNPKDRKAILAKEIIKMYHSEKEAELAEKEFNKVFRDKETPSEIPIFKTNKKTYPILDILKDAGLAVSKAEAKRIILGGGVDIIFEGKERRAGDWREILEVKQGIIIKAGKRKFAEISYEREKK